MARMWQVEWTGGSAMLAGTSVTLSLQGSNGYVRSLCAVWKMRKLEQDKDRLSLVLAPADVHDIDPRLPIYELPIPTASRALDPADAAQFESPQRGDGW